MDKLTDGGVELHQEGKFIKVHLFLIKCAVTDSSNGQTDDYTMERSKEERKTARVFTCGQTVKHTMASSGVMIAPDLVFFTTQMVNALRDCGKKERSMEKAFMSGPTAQNIM
jgi:hypothetical protein